MWSLDVFFALEFDDKPVIGCLFGNIILVQHHFATEMCQDNALRFQLCPVLTNIRIVYMKPDRLFIEVAFANEQIGVLTFMPGIKASFAAPSFFPSRAARQ